MGQDCLCTAILMDVMFGFDFRDARLLWPSRVQMLLRPSIEAMSPASRDTHSANDARPCDVFLGR